MHGAGNDFVVIDARKTGLAGTDHAKLAARLCDRHFGIGADGLLLVMDSDKADYRMRIFNPDGSEPEMCGNGIRCFAKYVWDSSREKKDVISVETLAGIIVPAVIAKNGVAVGAEVDMGEPKHAKDPRVTLKISGKSIEATEVSMGNPHCVIFVDDVARVNLPDLGPAIENHERFPKKTNVEFVQVIKENEITVRVWERGAGETLACGTGACASVVAGSLSGRTAGRVLVHLPGGDLDVEWEREDGHVALRGPAELVFEGKISI